MFGLLIKLAIIGGLFIGGGYLVKQKAGTLEPDKIKAYVSEEVSKVSTDLVKKNISSTLDSLVSNTDKNSPVVLGMKVSDESINTVVSVLQNLPPEQIAKLKSAICSPPVVSITPTGKVK